MIRSPVVDREPRIIAALEVEFERLGQRVLARSENVSRHGIFLRTTQFLPAGTVVELNIWLPDGPSVQLAARVAHVLSETAARALGREPGMGFMFLDQDPARLALLHRQIERQASLGRAATRSIPAPLRAVVAEGSTRMLERLATGLGGQGFAVESAQNGAEAYAACLERPPDVVLAAEDMPIMDGWILVRRLQAHPMLVDVPVVLMTDRTGDMARLEAYRLGVKDVLEKPFTDEEVALRLRGAAAQRRRTAEHVILRGKIHEVGLATLLSLLDFEHKSGMLILIRPGDIATLYVADGQVVKVDPVQEGESPREALFRLLDWDQGRFEFLMSDVVGRDEIDLPTSHVLIEHARLRDESGR